MCLIFHSLSCRIAISCSHCTSAGSIKSGQEFRHWEKVILYSACKVYFYFSERQICFSVPFFFKKMCSSPYKNLYAMPLPAAVHRNLNIVFHILKDVRLNLFLKQVISNMIRKNRLKNPAHCKCTSLHIAPAAFIMGVHASPHPVSTPLPGPAHLPAYSSPAQFLSPALPMPITAFAPAEFGWHEADPQPSILGPMLLLVLAQWL